MSIYDEVLSILILSIYECQFCNRYMYDKILYAFTIVKTKIVYLFIFYLILHNTKNLLYFQPK